MNSTQEFLVLETGDIVCVYGVSDFPPGTVVGGNAQRLRVIGHGLVRPPQTQLTSQELEEWRQHLREDGYTTAVEPFWR
jgi:hypothetical protein